MDRARTARALEVVISTGRTLKAWQASRVGGIADSISLKPLLLLPPREWLYRRCDERFTAMVESGAAEEVAVLLNRKLNPALPAMRAIGVRELAAYLAGEASLEDAISPMTPASILRTHANVSLFLDAESAALLKSPA